jgi:hypothetical protein
LRGRLINGLRLTKPVVVSCSRLASVCVANQLPYSFCVCASPASVRTCRVYPTVKVLCTLAVQRLRNSICVCHNILLRLPPCGGGWFTCLPLHEHGAFLTIAVSSTMRSRCRLLPAQSNRPTNARRLRTHGQPSTAQCVTRAQGSCGSCLRTT